jgi:DNA modification methylase
VNRILIGDCRVSMRELIAQGVKVQTVVTSPPYWGLRNYGIPPTIWGGSESCAHDWTPSGHWRRYGGTANSTLADYGNGLNANTLEEKNAGQRLNVSSGDFCGKCGAWRGDLGLEPTPWMWVAHIVEVFELVRELLADDGTCWLNLGDCHASDGGVLTPHNGLERNRRVTQDTVSGAVRTNRMFMDLPAELDQGAKYKLFFEGVKQKDMVTTHWAAAMALRGAGWWLRTDIIWRKKNPMPGSYKDRPTTTHEFVFLLAKRDRYLYDWEAIAEPCSPNTHARLSQDLMNQNGSARANAGARRTKPMKAVPPASAKDAGREEQGLKTSDGFGRGAGWRDRAPGVTPKSAGLTRESGVRSNESFHTNHSGVVDRRNKRTVWEGELEEYQQFLMWREWVSRQKPDVWTIGSEPYKGAHFATFPRALVAPCILAGSKPGQIVFDPFIGSGTTAEMATELGRQYLGCEIGADFEPLQRDRIAQPGLELA